MLHLFGLNAADSLETAAKQISNTGFSFIELENFLPQLAELIELRNILGLRSPVHSLARLLNPLNAPHVLQGIFHPGYKAIHRDAAALLEIPYATIIKGDGGEIEMNPDIDNETYAVSHGKCEVEHWPSLFGGQRHLKDETMDTTRLIKLWRGEISDEYGEGAVVLTAAVALKLLNKAETTKSALQLAGNWWEKRPKQKY
jgi:anthranilate phosphoribosyltransferase